MTHDCSILLDGGEKIDDVKISLPSGLQSTVLPPNATLKFLSLVETERIPLHLATSSPCRVSTANAETERWFRHLLIPSELEDRPAWWQAARIDSPIGILVSVCAPGNDATTRPRVTEILFYLSKGDGRNELPPSPSLSSPPRHGALHPDSKSGPAHRVCALPISSDLHFQTTALEPTPPASPTAEDVEIDGKFLPPLFPEEAQAVNQPPVRKRRSAVDAFDEASERRHKARRKGGEGVSAAAAPKTESQVPTLQHRRSGSNSQKISQPRPLSRSPSLAPSRPTTAVSFGARRSALSRMQSAADAAEGPDIESKNKDTISRIVMAGMRLYGLSQSKRRKSCSGSAAPSPRFDGTFDEREAERQTKDEEFKLIYHQVFKGTCLAFRASLATQQLHTFSNAIRDVADRLLSIFCSDPLAKDDLAAFNTNQATETDSMR